MHDLTGNLLKLEPNTSRPVSPANEADETLTTPTEESYPSVSATGGGGGGGGDDSIDAVQQIRRKSASSHWQKLNIKRRLSKVNMKISSTFDKRGFFSGATDGTPLSPVEVSPDSISNSLTPDTDTDIMAELEKEIHQNINDMETSKTSSPINQPESASNSDQESEPKTITEAKPQQRHWSKLKLKSILSSAASSGSSGGGSNSTTSGGGGSGIDTKSSEYQKKQRTISQPQVLLNKRVDFSEESELKSASVSNVDGGAILRPSELELFDEHGQPLPPLRQMKKYKRNRMLSVPNISFSNKDAAKLKDLRSRAEKDQTAAGPSLGATYTAAIFAGHLMRRFSKY